MTYKIDIFLLFENDDFQVIITFPHEDPPSVYLIPTNYVNQEIQKRMNKDLERFPDWCTPGCEDCNSVCDIDKIGIPVNLYGTTTEGLLSYEITRTFWYTVG
jgi:hypothetical protein